MLLLSSVAWDIAVPWGYLQVLSDKILNAVLRPLCSLLRHVLVITVGL